MEMQELNISRVCFFKDNDYFNFIKHKHLPDMNDVEKLRLKEKIKIKALASRDKPQT